MNMIQEAITRVKSPTPSFWKKIGNIGLTLAGVGTAIAGSSAALPAGLVAIGGYLIAAGSVAKAISMFGVEPAENVLPTEDK